MIDWITSKIPLKNKQIKNTGGFIKYDENGEVIFERKDGVNVEGSANSNIYLFSDNENLFISGNPAKFLQGQNVVGIDNAFRLTELMLFKLLELKVVDFHLFEIDEALEDSDIMRIDINYSFALNNNQDVDIFIETLLNKSKSRHGKATMTGGTLYYGKNSRRWSIKLYNKYAELLTAKEQKKLQNLSAEQYNLVMQKSKNIVRVELTLRSLELAELQFKNTKIKDKDLKKWIKNTKQYNKKNFKKLDTWNNNTMAKKIFDKYINKLDINAQIKLTDEVMLSLPVKLRATYIMWRDGYSIKHMLPKATYYKHKKELKAYGIDISIFRDRDNKTNKNVIEFKNVITAEPVDMLDDFKKLGLVAF